MRFTLNWLKDFLETDAALAVLVEKLTDIGLEVEEVVDRSASLEPFVVAEIIEAKQHPEADKLRVCTVNSGKEILQIVCGAPNARAGIKVVLAPIGSTIPTNGLKIKASKIRNIESHGMLCSARELGIGDDHNGIIELPSSAPLAAKFIEVCGLNDPVIEITITPNRADCLGVYGIARDLAAAGLGTLKPLSIAKIESGYDSPINIEIVNSEICPLFAGYYIKNVSNQESPEWLQKRLQAVGINSVSAIVDVTNYIALSFARPLHAYDADKINHKLIVRYARQNEMLKALNNKEYSLAGDELVIADDQKILGLGGIIGGEESSCQLSTTNIFIESALFSPEIIAQTGRRYNIDSDARYRFERYVDPAFVRQGAEFAAHMITEICGGEISKIVLAGNEKFAASKVKINLARLKTLGGVSVDTEEAITILDKLGLTVTARSENSLELTIPSWRGDIEGEADIVEEVARIYGYDKIEPELLPRNSLITGQALTPLQKKNSLVRRILAGRGFYEVVSWSFISSARAKLFGEIKPALLLKNPISAELDYMRPTIIANLLEAVNKNSLRNYKDLALFEIGPIYENIGEGGQKISAAGIRTGNNNRRNLYKDIRGYDVFDVKADIAAILEECGLNISNLELSTNAPCWYHPKRSASLRLGKNVIGYFGEIHPAIIEAFDLAGNVVAFELFIEPLASLKTKIARKPFIPSLYQAVERDFAFIADDEMPAELLVQSIKAVDRELITDVTIFDIYIGSNLPAGKKSIAISIVLQAKDRTFTDEEISTISANIVKVAEQKCGAVLRT